MQGLHVPSMPQTHRLNFDSSLKENCPHQTEQALSPHADVTLQTTAVGLICVGSYGGKLPSHCRVWKPLWCAAVWPHSLPVSSSYGEMTLLTLQCVRMTRMTFVSLVGADFPSGLHVQLQLQQESCKDPFYFLLFPLPHFFHFMCMGVFSFVHVCVLHSSLSVEEC